MTTTQLRDYYSALNALKEQEQTALAEAHAEDPRLLADRFRLSLNAIEGHSPIDEPFYLPGKRNEPPNPPTPVDDIKSTIHFASHLCDRRPLEVADTAALGFSYVDREISPLRTTVATRFPRRSLDLLLANAHDGTPIFAELKIGGDKPTYFAFVQVLMLAAELLSTAQRTRLRSPACQTFDLARGGSVCGPLHHRVQATPERQISQALLQRHGEGQRAPHQG